MKATAAFTEYRATWFGWWFKMAKIYFGLDGDSKYY